MERGEKSKMVFKGRNKKRIKRESVSMIKMKEGRRKTKTRANNR